MIVTQNNEWMVESFPMGSLSCNCTLIYSLSSKEAIVVDPGNDAEGLIQLLTERQLKVKKLLHTHAHFDHIGRSDTIRQHTGATLHLHRGDEFLYKQLREQGLFFNFPTDTPTEIDSYLNHQEEILVREGRQDFDPKIQVIHTPGHTPGSCCFYWEEAPNAPLLLSGDTLFQNSIGRTDLPGGGHTNDS